MEEQITAQKTPTPDDAPVPLAAMSALGDAPTGAVAVTATFDRYGLIIPENTSLDAATWALGRAVVFGEGHQMAIGQLMDFISRRYPEEGRQAVQARMAAVVPDITEKAMDTLSNYMSIARKISRDMMQEFPTLRFPIWDALGNSKVLKTEEQIREMARRATEENWSSREKARAEVKQEADRQAIQDGKQELDTIEAVKSLSHMVKVAPGFGANFWQECLQGGYICVGWDDLGDLQNYPTEAEFRKAFEQAYPYKNKLGKPSRSKMSAKANELWKFRTLKPGDFVAANDGASKILGVGTVLAPGYEYRPDRSAFHHTVRVQWDTSLARTIPKQGDWPLKTVSEIGAPLAQLILSGTPLPQNPKSTPHASPPIPVAVTSTPVPNYDEPAFAQIETAVAQSGLRLDEGLLRRYHLALKTRGFVILSGISGTGKTWLAEVYAKSVGAKSALIPVAPNWTTNEDLLGYLNPLSGHYHDTDFSRFLRRASDEYHRAENAGQTPHPYHVILDEMNLARVEYYFAKFLSLMEQRARYGHVPMELGEDKLTLPPNLVFIGTVNIDETTHGFADKVYDRAQFLEMTASRETLSDHIGNVPYRDALLEVWDAIKSIAPFAFRVVDEIKAYITQADVLGLSWQEALDEQLLQKVLPKLKGTDFGLGLALQHLANLPISDFPRTATKAAIMHQRFENHGFASFF